jgi:hypothetical protein
MLKAVRLFPFVMAAIGAALASPASGKNVVADVDQIAALLKKDGETLDIKSSKDGRYIRVTGDGYDYSIITYGCDDKDANCKSVQFYSGFNPRVNPTLEAMNSYARDNRWGRVYLDEEGDPAIEFDVDLEKGGMSEALFLDNVAYWEMIIDRYGDFVFGPNGENNNSAD